MRTNDENDAWMTYKLPDGLKRQFRAGCEKRGINMSALHRQFVESKVKDFGEEDTEKASA